MVDISKCAGNSCPLKNSCYRYLAVSSEYWQSWILEQYDFGTNKCDNYWSASFESNRKQNG